MLPKAVAWSSFGGVAISYLLPVLWMTSYLRISQGSSTELPSWSKHSPHVALDWLCCKRRLGIPVAGLIFVRRGLGLLSRSRCVEYSSSAKSLIAHWNVGPFRSLSLARHQCRVYPYFSSSALNPINPFDIHEYLKMIEPGTQLAPNSKLSCFRRFSWLSLTRSSPVETSPANLNNTNLFNNSF